MKRASVVHFFSILSEKVKKLTTKKPETETEEETSASVEALVEEENKIEEEQTPISQSDEKKNKEFKEIINDVKTGFVSFSDKIKNIIPKRKKTDKPADGTVIGRHIERTEKEKQSRAAELANARKESSAKTHGNNEAEDAVKRQFDNLDMITTSAIAIMLSETNLKAASPYMQNLKKPDIRDILLKFCNESYFATDIEQLNTLFSKKYYKWKIFKHFGRITVFVKRGIGDSLPKRTALRKARSTKNTFINKICETINTFESVKYITALSANEEISDSKRNYKLDHLSENYKDALIYLVDILLTCTCISKMLFVERMIRKMDRNSEFNKIITNMAKSIDNHNLIINKSRPIYKQYYQSELGYISGDDFLYGMAITIMVNRVKRVAIKNTSILKINQNQSNLKDFTQDMYNWLDWLAKADKVEDIGTLILHRITLSVRGNYSLLTGALQELINWENYYKRSVSFYKKEKDKERYLIGDFQKEKEELIRIE